MITLRRLEVEGGFLDGLDQTFSDGLNVLIGARGSGKTSVIEVLRYCLGIPAVTEKARERATDHALWVLDDGCATLALEVDGVERVIRRGLNQDDDIVVPTGGVLFVSQKEIEAIGDDANSRRRILDDTTANQAEPDRTLADIVARTAHQLHKQRSELDDVIGQLDQLKDVPGQLKEAEKQQTATKSESTELAKLQKKAAAVSSEVGELAEAEKALVRAAMRATEWREELEGARDAEPDFSQLPEKARAEIDDAITSARGEIGKGIKDLSLIAEALEARHDEASKQVNAKRRELADLNSKIEALAEGAGKISRALSALREQDKRRAVLEKRKKELQKKVDELVAARSAALDDMGTELNQRFERRNAAADALNAKFDGEIKVDVIKAGEVAGYEAALGRALEGSGLQWRSLSRLLAERMSPRELIAAVEALDAEVVADAAGISANRAKKLVSHLAVVDTTEITLADVDEDVEFSLLDGQDMKSTDRLSLGQRCTVVLPLLLARDPDLAVLDQPEDHLDNAFIVDTVVDVLRSRRQGSQRLVATHNANIPVLGEADKVLVMESSGSRAHVEEDGPLDDGEIVLSITKLMEGGEEAFAKRARFYGAKS